MMKAEMIAEGGAGLHRSIAPNGVPFTTLTSGGVKQMCEDYPALYPTEGEAWAAYMGQLVQFAAGASRMWVRRDPVMMKLDGGFTIYSRLTVE